MRRAGPVRCRAGGSARAPIATRWRELVFLLPALADAHCVLLPHAAIERTGCAVRRAVRSVCSLAKCMHYCVRGRGAVRTWPLSGGVSLLPGVDPFPAGEIGRIGARGGRGLY